MKIKLLIVIIACITFQIHSQSLNKEITKDDGKTTYLVGKIDKNGLEGENYKSWFGTNHSNYQPNKELINIIKDNLKAYKIIAFMGTWCGDSKKEIPKLYKVLEACDFPMEQFTLVAVSREKGAYKQSPQHEEEGLNIHRVPTIIFYKNGVEVNRIVEHPIDSFEADIANIITKNTYTSNYQIVSIINSVLKKKGAKGIQRKSKRLIKKYKSIVKSMYELNTYAYVLNDKNKTKEAIAIFRFNSKLFPEEPRAQQSLATILFKNNQKDDAIEVLENAIKIHPENKDLKENLKMIESN